jgi:hypothetical protein
MKFFSQAFFTIGLTAVVLVPYFVIPSVFVWKHDQQMLSEFREPEIEVSFGEDTEPPALKHARKEKIDDIRFHHIK